MSNEWKVVPGHYPGFLNITGASFDVSIVTTATDLSFEDFCDRTRDAHIMAASKDLLAALESLLGKAYKQNFNDSYPEILAQAEAAIAKARDLQS